MLVSLVYILSILSVIFVNKLRNKNLYSPLKNPLPNEKLLVLHLFLSICPALTQMHRTTAHLPWHTADLGAHSPSFAPDKAWYIRWKGDHVQANHLDLPHAFHQRLWFFWYVKEKFITSLTNCNTILDTEMYNNVTPLRPRLLWKVDPNNSLYLTRWHQNSI